MVLPIFILARKVKGAGKAAPFDAFSEMPEISHGEMAVMSDYRSGIIDLASRAVDTNEPFRRMLNYAEIQYSYCLWGR
ncbi:hypothetical protein ACC687_40870, partial [Rhizobium ruizarguesonis]